MAVYIRLECVTCDVQLVNDEKRKRYVHVNMAPEGEDHKPVVRSVKMGEA